MKRLLAYLSVVMGVLLLLFGIWLFVAMAVPPYAVLVLPSTMVLIGGILVYKGLVAVRC